MPSYKKRVHSQRIPQRERPAVTPYEGSYDEKYSSDEENVEYDVYEPEDLTERSNSTVTFSEDIYDSDVVEDMIKSQLRSPSQVSAEGSVKSEGVETLQEAGKPSKSILKNGKEKGASKVRGSLTEPERKTLSGPQRKDTISVSPTEMEKTLDEPTAVGAETVTSGKDKKVEKGEKISKEVTKPLQDVIIDKVAPVKGEKEAVTKSLQSTIPKQTHQITDTTATNKQDFPVKKGEEALESVTKPLRDQTSTKSDSSTGSKGIISPELLDEEEKALKDSITERDVEEEKPTVKRFELTEKLLPAKDSSDKNTADSKYKTVDNIQDPSTLSRDPSKLINGEVKSARNFVQENLDKAADEISKRKPDSESEISSGAHARTADDVIKPSKTVPNESITNALANVGEESVTFSEEIPKVTEELTSAKEKTKRDLEDKVAALPGEVIVTKEEATKKAQELIDEISKTVEKIIPSQMGSEEKSEITESVMKSSDEMNYRIKEPSAEDIISGNAHLLKGIQEMTSDEKIKNGKAIFLGVEEISNLTNSSAGKSEKILEDAMKLTQDISTKNVNAIESKKPSKDCTNSLGNSTPKEHPTVTEGTAPRKKFQNSVISIKDELVGIKPDTAAEVGHDEGKISETTNDCKQIAYGITRPLQEIVKSLEGENFKKENFLQGTENKVSSEVETSEKSDETLKNVKQFEVDDVPVAVTEDELTKKYEKVSSGVNDLFGQLSDSSALDNENTEKLKKDIESILPEIPNTLAPSEEGSVSAKADKIKDVKNDKGQEEKKAVVPGTVSSETDQSEGATESVGNQINKESEKPSQTEETKTEGVLSRLGSGLSEALEKSFSVLAGDTQTKAAEEVSETPEDAAATSGEAGAIGQENNEAEESQDSDSKPRVIFRIESEDELISDAENEVFLPSELSSSTEEFAERIKKDLKATLEKEQIKLEERLSAMKGGIFDISDESISKTKEMVDERLRKISEIKPPKEAEEPAKKEKSPARTDAVEEIKIGRFHITPALVEEVVSKRREKEIAERLKTTRDDDEGQEELEKELPEKLTEADLEEVIRELKLEGLNTDVYFQPEHEEKEEKKERTLKRVERRFERMASETLEMEKEEADSVSEEKLDEKREVEFQRMVSQLSSEEVAECQQEYLHLWEEGGLSSLTPTDDWESRDPDTPENELEEDSPRKPESFRGSHGNGKKGELTNISPTPKQSLTSPVPSPKPSCISDDKSSSVQSPTPLEPSRVGSSPSEVEQSSGFVSERSDDMPTYGERKKFWEQMSSSQSSETTGELPRSMHESISSVESFDADKKPKNLEGQQTILINNAKQALEKETPERPKSIEESGFVKSLTESYSKKIAAGELIMPAIPRPVSTISVGSLDSETEQIVKAKEVDQLPDSAGTAVVSELEVKFKSRSPSAPITEKAVIFGSTELEEQGTENVEFTIGSTVITKAKKKEQEMSPEKSPDSETEILIEYGIESVAFDNSAFSEEDDGSLPLQEGGKFYESAFEKGAPLRKSIYDRSMSLPSDEIAGAVRGKKKYFESDMRKEIIVEQIMARAEKEEETEEGQESVATEGEKEILSQKKLIFEMEESAANAMTDFDLVTKVTEESSKTIAGTEKVSQQIFGKVPKNLSLRESHLEKSETEDNEKEKSVEGLKWEKKEESVPSITVTSTGKKQTETGSVGESEDTQSESDVTPEDARIVDNEECHWDGSGTQSGGASPKDDLDYGKEIGETGIGRWIGQEDLSKQSWEKDELDSSHFKIHTKWERTRSEGTSPKEHHVYTPEEHYPDTVWEVPVQEQLEKEEVTHDIPIEKQVIIEKDEEEEDDDEEEKRIKLTEGEAKEIAEEILEYIQFEVENRSSFLVNDYEEEDAVQCQVSDYLRHLADDKDLDDQDVQLIENVIMKKHRDQFRKSQINTTGSSIDITDEELRSSGADNDISPVESQITKLQNLEEEDFVKMSTPGTEKLENIQKKNDFSGKDAINLKDAEMVDQTIAEVKESLEAAQEQLIEQHKKRKKNEILKKESPSEFEFRGISYERCMTEAIKEQTSDWEKLSEFETETKEGELSKGTKKAEGKEKTVRKDTEQTEISKREKMTGGEKLEEEIKHLMNEEAKNIYVHKEETESKESGSEKFEKKLTMDLTDEEKKSSENKEISSRWETKDSVNTEQKSTEKSEIEQLTKKSKVSVEERMADGAESERFDSETLDRATEQRRERESHAKDTEMKSEKIRTSLRKEKKEEASKNVLAESEERITTMREGESVKQSSVTSSRSVETSKADLKTSQKSLVTEIQGDFDKVNALEINVPESYATRKLGAQRHSSEDSPKSMSAEECVKSPAGEEISSADKPGEIKSDKSDIVFRHSSSSSIHALLKGDRRSGTDLEAYSSSGESHYHSFEQAPSRPCSSDVEVLMAGNVGTAGSSEYESALSQDTSSKQATSTDYHTAVSSLSSRESIKSLDSESSGHLASVEVSSEASETLIPSALELDKDLETPGVILLDDDISEITAGPPPPYVTQMSAPAPTTKSSMDEDFEIVSESEVASWAGEVSEDEEGVPIAGEELVPDEDHSQKMKRSYEMTFQPEPKPIVFSESLDGLSKDNFADKLLSGLSVDESSSGISAPDERFGSSLEESGSVLSMSLSTTSEPSAARTVIELSRTDSEKMDGSLTVSATSIDSTSREDLEKTGAGVVTSDLQPLPLTNEMSTSTVTDRTDKKTASVTITTSSSDDHGIPSVSTQVTSVSRKSSVADEARSESESSATSTQPSDLSHANGPTQVDYVADYDEIDTGKTKKTQGHRRKESTSNFVPTMMWNLSEARTQKLKSDFSEIEEKYESDKFVYDVILTEKEVKNDEKKEADDSESIIESHAHEEKIFEEEDVEEFKDYDGNRSHSPTSKTDSESGRRPISSVFSEDQPDSELSELMKQGSSETEKEDPLERPLSPEPEDMENKDITPEFSSEAQASVTELEMEYSGACSRRDEYASHVSPIREEKSEVHFRDATADEAEEEERLSDGLHSQTSLESTVAEKHELETGEKEILQKKLNIAGSNDIPDITVTEHVTPVLNQKFQYPDSKEEPKEKKNAAKTPDTPASTSSRTSSTSTDQGREYSLDEAEIKKFPREVLSEEKEVNETKDDKESLDSPSSDSFEMLDKPDITDEFVIIEEVGREAHENDQEGKSIQITSGKKKLPKRAKEEEVILSPSAPSTKMTDLKYFPSEEDTDLFSFDSESPPQPTTRRFADKLKRKSSKEEKEDLEYEQQIEQSKKWVEMQFQGEQAAKIVGAYGYEMEYERAPLEDIKEEDLNELESSSKIGSMGSQKESLGSFGSVKDSFSSTPDYDVLAGKKYFTRSGDHDDVSMSSLQEFELIEKKLMENGKKSGSSSSQDSLSSKKLGTSSKSGQGDDISQASLREFEHLESACATVVKMETKAKQEELILSEIDEGHESQISESESCETVSAVMKEKIESDSEDFDKRMFEIDEIIRQAQSNVEKFSEMQALEKIESMGRGDSYEEVAKVPDLELDMPLSGRSDREHYNPKHDKGGAKTSYSTQVVTKKKIQQWRATEGEPKPPGALTYSASRGKPESAKNSELLENGGKIKSISADSLEIQAKEKQKILEEKDDTISLDSYKRKSQKSENYVFSEMTQKSDSMEEVSASLKHHEGSSGEHSLSGREDGKDHAERPPPRADFMLGSTDSLDPSSSTATHATYQYETDSVMSSSFTSGGSNTMVSSTDNLDLLVSGQSVIDLSKDFEVCKTQDWLEQMQVGSVDPSMRKRVEDKNFGHQNNQVETGIQKIAFEGPDAEKEFQAYLDSLGPEEEIVETSEIDEQGNVHVKKVLRKRVVIKRGESGEGEASHSELPSTVEKITFTGPNVEEALTNYTEKLKTENKIIETKEVDEYGNVHIKTILKQKILVQPEDVELEEWKRQDTGGQSTQTFKVSHNGKTLQKHLENVKETKVVEEIEETDEYGNVDRKKVTRRHDEAKPSTTVTEEEFSDQMFLGMEDSFRLVREKMKTGTEVEKITFKGSDAEKQFEEFMARQQSEEMEEIEEEDEFGNVHVKRVLRRRMFIRPEDVGVSEVQKVTFEGGGADEALQAFVESFDPEDEVSEIEEEDEHGNIHVRKVLRQRVIIRPEELGDRQLTKEELQEYLKARSRETTFSREKVDVGSSGPFVSEIIEPLDDKEFSHIVHRKVQMGPDVHKVVFRGPDADKALEAYVEALGPGEDFEETQEVDQDGNVHVKRIMRRKIVLKPEDYEKTGLRGEELKSYLEKFEHETFEGDGGLHPQSFDPTPSTNLTLTEAFSSSIKLTEKEEQSTHGKDESESTSAIRKESGICQRPPLLSDISMDDEAEYDTTEHDWRHQLEILHAEADEDEIDQNLDAALAASSSPSQKNN